MDPKKTSGKYISNYELELTPDPEVDLYQRVDGYHVFTDKKGIKSLWRVTTSFVRVATADDEQALIEAARKANEKINNVLPS